jgi:hypothetical protein
VEVTPAKYIDGDAEEVCLDSRKGAKTYLTRDPKQSIEELLEPLASSRLLRFYEWREKLSERQRHTFLFYHSYIVLEVEGGVSISLEENDGRVEMMCGRGPEISAYITQCRATGEKRKTSLMQESEAVTCLSRKPVVGDKVIHLDGHEILNTDSNGNADGWLLKQREIATVVEVDESGDFRLRNAEGVESTWSYRKFYGYLSQELDEQLTVGNLLDWLSSPEVPSTVQERGFVAGLRAFLLAEEFDVGQMGSVDSKLSGEKVFTIQMTPQRLWRMPQVSTEGSLKVTK